MRYKYLFLASVLINIAGVSAFFIKRAYFSPIKHTEGYTYLDNWQYAEQESIFPAYKSPADIAFIGDSHIFKCHWDELLDTPVINRGIGSDNIYGIYNRVDEIIKLQPKYCFIMCGINDINQGITLDTLDHYLTLTKDRLKRAGIKPVVMGVMKVSESYAGYKWFNEQVVIMNDRIKPDISIELDPEDYQQDGLHINGRAYLKWKLAILNRLRLIK